MSRKVFNIVLSDKTANVNITLGEAKNSTAFSLVNEVDKETIEGFDRTCNLLQVNLGGTPVLFKKLLDEPLLDSWLVAYVNLLEGVSVLYFSLTPDGKDIVDCMLVRLGYSLG